MGFIKNWFSKKKANKDEVVPSPDSTNGASDSGGSTGDCSSGDCGCGDGGGRQ